MPSGSTDPVPPPSPVPELDPVQTRYLDQRLKAEQDLGRGMLACSVTAGFGACCWAALTVATGYKIGFIAIGLGYLVGYAMRSFGRGVETMFGVVGASFALAGCILGNLLAACGMLAMQTGRPFLEVLAQLTLQSAGRLLLVTFQPMDVVFYVLAVYEAYRLSFRTLSDAERRRLAAGLPSSYSPS